MPCLLRGSNPKSIIMRFLCLHGYATNAEVLEQQLLPLRNHLPSDWEFEFLEARHEPSSIFLRKLQHAPTDPLLIRTDPSQHLLKAAWIPFMPGTTCP